MRRLEGRLQHYDWGSREEIARILGRQADGRPWAEYWLGAHASAPSLLTADGHGGEVGLDEWLEHHPEELGEASRRRFGDRLAYLLKILSAAQPLSIQAHPSHEQAERGFAAENEAGIDPSSPSRIFRDDWPKPEMIVALEPFDALCGFREPSTSLVLLSGLGPIEGLDEVLEPLRTRPAADGLAAVLRRCLTRGEEVAPTVSRLVEAARDGLAEGRFDPEVATVATTAVDLDAAHPGDPSILAALLMNRVRLAPGEQIHLGAGTLHAYLRGTGIEIMANSDNVLRGGLTSKHVDADALLDLAVLDPCVVQGRGPEPTGGGDVGGVEVYRTPFPEFRLWRCTDLDEVTLPCPGSGRILLVVAGRYRLRAGEEDLALTAGEAAWLPCAECPAVSASGEGLAFLAGPGLEDDSDDEELA